MRIGTLVCIVFVLTRCSHHNDERKTFPDIEFKSNFQNCIEIIAVRQSGHSIRLEYTEQAYECLEALTHHLSKVDKDSDTPLFYPYDENRNYFLEDLGAWFNWYEENKNLINMRAAESAFRRKRNDLTWPPSLIEVTVRDSIFVGY